MERSEKSPRARAQRERGGFSTLSPSGLKCGKRMTSRIEYWSVRSMTSLSIPTPTPPAGGMPYARFRRRRDLQSTGLAAFRLPLRLTGDPHESAPPAFDALAAVTPARLRSFRREIKPLPAPFQQLPSRPEQEREQQQARAAQGRRRIRGTRDRATRASQSGHRSPCRANRRA